MQEATIMTWQSSIRKCIIEEERGTQNEFSPAARRKFWTEWDMRDTEERFCMLSIRAWDEKLMFIRKQTLKTTIVNWNNNPNGCIECV